MTRDRFTKAGPLLATHITGARLVPHYLGGLRLICTKEAFPYHICLYPVVENETFSVLNVPVHGGNVPLQVMRYDLLLEAG